jgi:hypothetical protein
MALACFERWKNLEGAGSLEGVDNLKKLCDAGGAKATVTVMAAHAPTNAALAERGCRALATIAHGNVENKRIVMEAGGAGAIADVMNAHPQTPEVIIQSIVALANLAAGDDECKSEIVKAEGPAVCAKALVAHCRDNVTLALQAIRLLANLTSIGATADAVISSGGVPATSMAMAVHWLDRT